MARATSSFPVPVSPWIITLESVGHDGHQMQGALQCGTFADDCTELRSEFFFEIESLFRLFVSILCRPFVLQRVLYGNRYLARHLLKQQNVVLLKRIVRTPGEHKNANHAVTAPERKITPHAQAFLDHALINKPALSIAISLRILSDLLEAIDSDALAAPQNENALLTRKT
jgi:hypothetical protein